MFKKMLLDALEKSPPRTVDDLAVFFERSRSRLEQSLDKGQVSEEERARYLAQFQAGLNEAQVDFLNTALLAHGDVHDKAVPDELNTLDKALFGLRQPLIWALLVFLLLLGMAIGLLLAG